jgi:hypothetical protein
MADVVDGAPAVLRPRDPDARMGRFTEAMRAARRRQLPHDRKLALAGAVLAPTGVVLVVLGWWGAAGSAREFEQIPFLISGGLLGLALVVTGSALFVGAWMTRLVSAARTSAAHAGDTAGDIRRLAATVERLEAVVAELAADRAPAPAPRRKR